MLSREQRAIRDLAQKFVGAEIEPNAREWDRSEELDRSVIGKLGEVGLLGATIPEEYGGTPADHVAYSLIIEELGRGDSSVRGVMSVSMGLVAKTILSFGTEAQRQRWLPDLCTGEAIGCFALTEPDTGSDAGSLRTRATRTADGWQLDGSKMFITNGTWADVALVFARTDDSGPRGISAFLVPTDREGLSRSKVRGKLGLRAQDTAEIVFNGVAVTAEDLVGEENEGFKLGLAALAKGRLSVAAGAVGIAQACLNHSLAYATERKQFGKPIASFQLIQGLLADMSVETEAARMLVWQTAELIDAGQPYEIAASRAKYYASETAVRAANSAVQVFGGYGYIDESPVGRLMRDARVTTLYEGTSQIQKLLIGRNLTGINAFV